MADLKVILNPTGTSYCRLTVNSPQYVYLEPTGVSYGDNLVLNADGDNTTDWIDTNSDGLGDYWSCGSFSFMTPIIGNNNHGFSNYYQQITRNNDVSGAPWLLSNDFGITNAIGKKYHFWIQYRSSYDLLFFQTHELTPSWSGHLTTSFPATSGDAVSLEYEWTVTAYNNFFGIFFTQDTPPGTGPNSWFAIDKIMVKEVL